MLCRAENEDDPRKCVKDGKEVTSCAMNFLRMVSRKMKTCSMVVFFQQILFLLA